jgi:hypothetical protein
MAEGSRAVLARGLAARVMSRQHVPCVGEQSAGAARTSRRARETKHGRRHASADGGGVQAHGKQCAGV